jgi:hypothetical protein
VAPAAAEAAVLVVLMRPVALMQFVVHFLRHKEWQL